MRSTIECDMNYTRMPRNIFSSSSHNVCVLQWEKCSALHGQGNRRRLTCNPHTLVPSVLSDASRTVKCIMDCKMSTHPLSRGCVARATVVLGNRRPHRRPRPRIDDGPFLSPFRPQAPIFALAFHQQSYQALPPSLCIAGVPRPRTTPRPLSSRSIPVAPARRSLAFLGRAYAGAKG